MQSSAPPSGRRGMIRKFIETWNKISDIGKKVKGAAFCLAAPAVAGPAVATQPGLANTAFDLVTEEETGAAFVYKMDRQGHQANELRVEIRWANALWVISLQRDEPIKVKLQRNHEMRLSEATASMSADGVLTVEIPKRDGSRKWYEYKDLAFNKFKTFCVEVSQS